MRARRLVNVIGHVGNARVGNFGSGKKLTKKAAAGEVK